MTKHQITYLYIVFILHLQPFSGGFGFQSFCRPHRWGATTKTSQPYHPTSPIRTSSSSSSPFSNFKFQSRNPPLILKLSSIYQEEEEEDVQRYGYSEIRNWLQNRLDLSDKEIEQIHNTANVFRPRIEDGDVSYAVSSRIESLDNKIDFLQKRLNVTDKEIKGIFTRSKTLLERSSENVAEKLNWLQCRLDLDDKQLSTLVRRASSILQRSIEDNLSQKLTWLEERLDLNTTQQLRTFVLRFPALFCFQIETLDYKMNWYKNRFNFPDSEKAAKKIIRRKPPLVSVDIESVDETLTWFQNRLDLTDFQLYKIIQGCPSILASHADDKLEPCLCFLASRFCLDESGLRTMICKYPTLFSISIGNIESTMEFYESLLGKSDAIRCCSNNPRYLASSLEGRLKPRLANVTKLGLVVGQDVPLTNLAKFTDEKWEEYMENL